MPLGRILATIALVCALAVITLGVWLGDTWGIVMGVLAVFSAATSTAVVWRARQ